MRIRHTASRPRNSRNLLWILVAALVAMLAARVSAAQTPRAPAQPPLALVIGNGDYRHVVSLPNPPSLKNSRTRVRY
jgi:hypothetical protein